MTQDKTGLLGGQSTQIPREAAIAVQEARAALASAEGLLNSALGVGSTWEWRPLVAALEHVEQARRHLQGVNDDVE